MNEIDPSARRRTGAGETGRAPDDAKMMKEDHSMSSRIFQSVMIQMKDATDRVLGVVDRDGFVVACSELSLIGSYLDGVQGLTGEVSDQIVTRAGRTGSSTTRCSSAGTTPWRAPSASSPASP